MLCLQPPPLQRWSFRLFLYESSNVTAGGVPSKWMNESFLRFLSSIVPRLLQGAPHLKHPRTLEAEEAPPESSLPSVPGAWCPVTIPRFLVP